jgi:hypothetical protein
VSVSGNYVLEQVWIEGSIGTLWAFSSSTKNWYAPDNNTKTKEFENGTEEAFIRKLVVKYKSKG